MSFILTLHQLSALLPEAVISSALLPVTPHAVQLVLPALIRLVKRICLKASPSGFRVG